MEYTNHWSYDVCWKGIRVKPGETVTNNTKKKEKIKIRGVKDGSSNMG